MDYIKIIKRSFVVVWKNKFLWILGLLAGGTGHINLNLYSFNSGDWSNWFKSEDLPDKVRTSLSSGMVKGQTAASDLTNINQWASNHWWLILLIIGIIFILGIALMIISYCCQGGLIEAVNEIEKGNKSSFGRAFVAGWHRFWSLLAINLLIFIILAVLIVYMILAAIVSFMLGAKIFAIFWLIGLLPTIIILAIYLGLLGIIAWRSIMVDNLRAIAALEKANVLLLGNFKEIILAWLVMIVLGIVIGLALLIVFGILFGILTALGVLVFVGGKLIATIVFGSIIGLALLILVLLVSGFIQAVMSGYWTLVYKELKA